MNSSRSSYKDCVITTRWTELGSLAGMQARRFVGSFVVVPAREDAWQESSPTIFATSDGATDAAMVAAKTSIDSNAKELGASPTAENAAGPESLTHIADAIAEQTLSASQKVDEVERQLRGLKALLTTPALVGMRAKDVRQPYRSDWCRPLTLCEPVVIEAGRFWARIIVRADGRSMSGWECEITLYPRDTENPKAENLRRPAEEPAVLGGFPSAATALEYGLGLGRRLAKNMSSEPSLGGTSKSQL